MSDLLISEQNGYRTLHFGSEWVQGRMRISRPAELALGYAQEMCAALLFVPPPKQVYIAGLGVGSLPRWALTHWAENLKRLDIVELRADVIALSHHAFLLPHDDARLRITEGDAAQVIRERRTASFDWIWVDCYDGWGQVGALESAEFYETAYTSLKKHGVFVANMWSGVARYRSGLKRLRAVFGDNIVLLPSIGTENVCAIASKATLPLLESLALQKHAKALRTQYKLPFDHWLKRLAPICSAL